MKRTMTVVVLTLAAVALAGPKKFDPEEREERHEEHARKARMMMLVAVSEALELNEAQALKLAEKLRGLDEKRRPVREAMGEAMKQLKAAAEGDTGALAQLDANVQRVLDGRVQMAQLDKELFATLGEGQPPQKRAKLAVVLARMADELRKLRGGGKGRFLQRD